jgi:hypothetical protein
VELLIKEPEKKNAFAIDVFWKVLQRSGNWYMIVPATVTQYTDYSDVEGRVVNYDHLMLDVEKKWLFSNISNINNKIGISMGPFI